MSLAQPKTGQLIDQLRPSLLEGKNLLSEFEIHQIYRDAKRIPELFQRLSIEGLVGIVIGDVDEGCSLCERGILLAPNDPVSFCNYTTALRNFGLLDKHYEMQVRAAKSFEPRILAEVVTVSAYWADIDLLEKVLPMLKAMEVPLNDDFLKSEATLEYLQEHREQAKDLKQLGQLMMKVAQDNKLRLAGARVGDNMSELYTYIVGVKTEDAELLSKINNNLIDEILAAGLENSDCIGYFEAGEL